MGPKIRVMGGGPGCEVVEHNTEECNTHPCPVDCEWDEWTFGECDLPCGGGLRTNTRDIRIREQFGGHPCAGDDTIIEACNTFSCPVDCQWEEWTIGECSKTCGTGTQQQIRDIAVMEQFGGHPCVGDYSVTVDCNTDPCPVSDCADQYAFCPRDAELGHCEVNEWLKGVCPLSCEDCD